NKYKVESDPGNQNYFSPADSPMLDDCVYGQHYGEQRGYCGLQEKSCQGVIPPAVRLQLAERIDAEVLYVVRVHQSRILEVQEGRDREEICGLDYNQGGAANNGEPFECRTPVAYDTQYRQENRQESAGKLRRHCCPQRESGNCVQLPR